MRGCLSHSHDSYQIDLPFAMAEVVLVVPADMWICCYCNAGNLLETANEYCPVCGHQICSACLGPGETYNATLAMGFPTDSLPLAGGSFASLSPSSSGRLPASSPHEHHVSGPNNANIITNTREDVWTCCQCHSVNLTANSPERCPVCEHFKGDHCT